MPSVMNSRESAHHAAPKGKRLTIVTVSVALVVLAASVVASRGVILERWKLYQLSQAQTAAEVREVLEWIREHGTVRSLSAVAELDPHHNELDALFIVADDVADDDADDDADPSPITRTLISVIQRAQHDDSALLAWNLRKISDCDVVLLLVRRILELEPENTEAVDALQSCLATICVRDCLEILLRLGIDPSVGLAAGLQSDNQGRIDYALQQMRVAGPRARGALVAAREREARWTGRHSLDALLFLAEYGGGDAEDRNLALRCLTAIDAAALDCGHPVVHWLGAEAVPYLVATLLTFRATDIPDAWSALRRLRGEAKAALPTLLSILVDETRDDCDEAARVLEWLGPPPDGMLPTLVQRLMSENPAARAAAAHAIALAGPKAREALPSLRAPSETRDLTTQVWVRCAIARIEPASVPDVVNALTEHLSSLNLYVLEAAAAALGTLGPAAKSAVPRLVRHALGSHSLGAEEAAREALARIGIDDIAPLLEALRGADRHLRKNAARCLTCLGQASAEVLETVRSQLRSGDEDTVLEALNLAAHLGEKAAALLPEMDALLTNWVGDGSFRRLDSLVESRGAILRAINRPR